ncbi:hypothetical protein HPSA50_0132 [Helicobacter pylori SouthAfrica50]|uniref:Uncharacterized protein n=1 Tax=Helicobacter pylori SouthAfrica50 TaxID=1352357 RepID=T2SBV0_HELPX|nr:hypothetical protein HPSA50_0132 [Helicobacter pylori SouthAfrica50]
MGVVFSKTCFLSWLKVVLISLLGFSSIWLNSSIKSPLISLKCFLIHS